MQIFLRLLRQLVSPDEGAPVSKLDVEDQFRPEQHGDDAVLRNFNSAFLLSLTGQSHPLYAAATEYLNDLGDRERWRGAADFYLEALELIPDEFTKTYDTDPQFRARLNDAASWLDAPGNAADHIGAVERYREVFFPEGAGICQNTEKKIAELREKRKITLKELNPAPIRKPSREVLFTSNVLLTVPLDPGALDTLALAQDIKGKVDSIVKEEQAYWYDHPIPLGIERDGNEALYGLRGLDAAVAFEKQKGVIGMGEKLDCVLSVSVTHKGLHGVAREYIGRELNHGTGIEHLNVYIFTEADTARLIDDILAPAIRHYLGPEAEGHMDDVRRVIGVDGEYGRHYTFLKALSAFWQVMINTDTRGTFKIDLDQVFPQEALLQQSGKTALEHLRTPLWGAVGTDANGREVELGMLAGALANRKDIGESLFVPDVRYPPREAEGEAVVFQSALPQALSTEAEMMTRYGAAGAPDGRGECLQRIHVTGGTSGILIDSLRRHRPFTPVFIGRAEDQAYVMSVLYKSSGRTLRCVHCDGLVMRHDKEAFASDAIEASHIGKIIGDYARILWFTYYSRALPWSVEATKDALDPFTGCFISKLPFTVVCLSLALRAARHFGEGSAAGNAEGRKLLEMGTLRLRDLIRSLRGEKNPLIEEYEREKAAWDVYYDAIDRIEEGLRGGDVFALELLSRAKLLVEDCTVELSP